MLKTQHGCAICHSVTPQSKLDWAVDHDHATGVVRGILCHPCNRLLGAARDDAEILRSAIDYLARLKPPGWIAPDIAGLLAVEAASA